VFVRLTLEQSRDGLVATISEHDAAGNVSGPPMMFLTRTKDEAKKKASAVAKGLGLTSYRVMDKSGAAARQKATAPDRAP